MCVCLLLSLLQEMCRERERERENVQETLGRLRTSLEGERGERERDALTLRTSLERRDESEVRDGMSGSVARCKASLSSPKQDWMSKAEGARGKRR